MSLITRCPACQTLFKVVPDQLRVSEGWVRCGQCDEIFDASLELLPLVSAATPASIQIDTDIEPDSSDLDLSSAPLPAPPQILPEALAAVDHDAVAEELVERLTEEKPTPTPEELAQPEPTDLEGPQADRRTGFSKISFLRDPRAQASQRTPLVHALLLGLTLTLVLGLAGQIILHERNRIVALEPGLRPWLLALCRPLNCTLSPLQHKDSVVIEGASFSKIRGDAYRLSFTLKNTESMALAVPAIELTLTDSLDQPVVRRVFYASELGIKSESLAAAAEWSASLAMAIKTAGTAERIVGYRLLAFYP